MTKTFRCRRAPPLRRFRPTFHTLRKALHHDDPSQSAICSLLSHCALDHRLVKAGLGRLDPCALEDRGWFRSHRRQWEIITALPAMILSDLRSDAASSALRHCSAVSPPRAATTPLGMVQANKWISISSRSHSPCTSQRMTFAQLHRLRALKLLLWSDNHSSRPLRYRRPLHGLRGSPLPIRRSHQPQLRDPIATHVRLATTALTIKAIMYTIHTRRERQEVAPDEEDHT